MRVTVVFSKLMRLLRGHKPTPAIEREIQLLAARPEEDELAPWDEKDRLTVDHPVLIFGRFCSAKMDFMEGARARAATKIDPILAAKDITVKWTNVAERTFKLICTPGFDNPGKSNLEVFENLVNHLLTEKLKPGVIGLIYIHHARDPLQSRALRQNLNVLFNLIVGKSCFPRLTILVVPGDSGPLAHCVSVVAEMETTTFQAVKEAGARFMISRFDQGDISNILGKLATLKPIQLEIQKGVTGGVRSKIEVTLGYCEADSMKLHLKRRQELVEQKYHPELEKLQKQLDEAESNLKSYHSAYKQIEDELRRRQDDVDKLRVKLKQTQLEYSSLRSQLQLQENTEQSEVVQSLKDLNRTIDDIGRSLSEYLFDKYVTGAFEKDSSEVTSLDARNIEGLRALFGHVEGKTSLVSSSTGAGVMVEDFFDYGVRSLLCAFLCRQVFSTFHPAVDAPSNRLVGEMYQDIQHREPQAVSAKWRTNTFKSIYRPENDEAIMGQIIKLATDFSNDNLMAFFQAFFGEDRPIEFEGKQFNQLCDLFRAAWDWNAKLKGEVIVLGDFYQTCFDFSTPFDPNYMEEFEPRGKGSNDTVLGTLALGLVSTRAVGGGNPLEVTVVCKATVATEKTVYD